jgi:hypothetical protein
VNGWLELIGLAGIIVVLAGVHQLWLAREEVLFWMRRFVDLFRAALGRESTPRPVVPRPRDAPGGLGGGSAVSMEAPRAPAYGTLHLVGGVGLIALGSALFLFSLAVVVYRTWSDS